MDKQIVINFGIFLGDLKELISDILTTWINLQNSVLTERSQTQKSIYTV